MDNKRKWKSKVLLGTTSLLLAATMGLAACTTTPGTSSGGSSSDSGSSSGSPEIPSLGVPDYEGKYAATNAYEEHLKLNGKFYTDYATMHQAFVAGAELNVKIAEEGMVLLKNENNALPLNKYEARATAFGYRSVNLQTGGGGSGSAQLAYVEAEGLSIATLESSLKAVGMQLNSTMADYYVEATAAAGRNAAEFDPDTYPGRVINSYYDYNDVALVVFARGGSEGSDLSSTPDENGKHSLSLTLTEEAIIRHAKKYFNKVVVLINAANCMELGELQEKKTADNLGVDAILQIGHVGVDGATAIGEILTGKVNPSGHTVDTWERKFLEGPSGANFGTMAQNGTDPTTGEAYNNSYYMNGATAGAYRSVEYREDIYMGYKWYETVHADKNTAQAGSGDAWYDQSVVYPFGYGLSYTSFDWELDPSIAEKGLIDSPDGTITVKVKVTNTGMVAGKDVVQVYFTPPYKNGGIEKAEVNLAGFVKTKLLQPGESDVVTVQFAAQDMASFDWNDKNGNGFVGYELEAGDYVISARSDAHTVEAEITRTVEGDIKCETDLTTGATINAVFSQTEGKLAAYNTTNDALLDNLTTREGGLTGETPKASTAADRTITQSDLDIWASNADAASYNDDADDPWYVGSVPGTWTQTAESVRQSGTGKTAIQLKDMAGVSYTEPVLNADGTVTLGTDEGSKKWDEFMNQLTWEEMEAFALAGGWGRRAIPAIGNPEAADQDGPNQLGNQAGRTQGGYSPVGPNGYISGGGDLNNANALGSGTCFISAVVLASTWNIDLAEQEGRLNGNFSLFLNCPGWYGPGMNTHRSPFGGRNFEYYSEDGVMGGKMAAAVVRGATQKGVVCYAKHLALNEQETNRSNIHTFVTEQAFREIYLKPFELSVKEGGIMGFMTAMGYLGTWAAYSNGALQNNLIRAEWGFKGVFETDANGSGGAYKTLGIMLRNGTDINLARTTMVTTNTRNEDIVNAEATYWDPTARGGKGMVMTAADSETRNATNTAIHGGWTEGLNGTTEFRYYNWRDKSVVADQLTLASPTYYYWLRLAVMHTLYVSANSNSINNGMPSWMWYGDVVDEIDVHGMIGADGTVTFDKTVVSELDIEEGVKVTEVHIAQTSDLPAYTSHNATSRAAIEALIEQGIVVPISNDDVPEWISVNNLGVLTVNPPAAETPAEGEEAAAIDYAGEYTIIITVQLDYFHVINIQVNLTIA